MEEPRHHHTVRQSKWVLGQQHGGCDDLLMQAAAHKRCHTVRRVARLTAAGHNGCARLHWFEKVCTHLHGQAA